jgi:hypothetical protein
MATRSRIAIENQNGTVTSIYCHWDGYPSHNGKILTESYGEREKVQALIDLGDISSLAKNLEPEPGSRHSITIPADDTTVAYHRDNGEDLRSNSHRNRDHFVKSDIEQWGYLFTLEGEWLVADGSKSQPELVPVSGYLK